MDKFDSNYSLLLSVYADMIIEESIRDFWQERLYAEIDAALSTGDEERFLILTTKLNELNAQTYSH